MPTTFNVFSNGDSLSSTQVNLWGSSINNLEKCSTNYANGTGTDAYAVSLSPALITSMASQQIWMLCPNDNTGAAVTLAVNSIAAVAVKLQNGSDPYAGAMKANGVFVFVFNGTNWILLNPIQKVVTLPLFADMETPTGSINSSNTSFTIANAPSPDTSLQIFQQGLLLNLTTNYTLSGSTITFVVAPTTGYVIKASYRH
jgi:hypothetical protein